jgi:CRISPR type IV-associated protein Csf3
MKNSFKPLKITFHLDGTGLYYNPCEPIHLDALLAWVVAGYVAPGKCIQRDDVPDVIPLPLAIWSNDKMWGFCASALFSEENIDESVLMWRKKFRENRIEQVANASPNLTNGPYRNYNVPLQLLLTHKMTAWCVGDRRKVLDLVRRIKFLGKKKSIGLGRVLSIEVLPTEENFSLVNDEGLAMRWLPLETGARLVRSRPPYWNNSDRGNHCEVGETYDVRQLHW